MTPHSPQTLHLPAQTHMGSARLAVADLGRSVDFYSRVVGLRAQTSDDGARLWAGETLLIELYEKRGAIPQPRRSTGLYHLAILVPSQADLGRVVLNIARHKQAIQGFGDHFVSEAMYLADPDGNGLEIYRDRPRSEWRWNGSQVVMGTENVDVDALIASVPDPSAPFTGLPDGTVMGHVHLRVGDIQQAKAFYVQTLGFEAVSRFGDGALFVSAGGYHHHLGLNTWQSAGAPPPPDNAVGLLDYSIIVPAQADLQPIAERLEAGGYAFSQAPNSLSLADPWHNHLHIVALSD
jgi:catechol 2,3-dioxygenase